MNKKGLLILNNLVFVLMLLAYISNGRIIEIGNNLSVNLTYFIYPLVYLFLAVICKFFDYKEAKKSIRAASIGLIITIILIMILNLIPSNIDSIESELMFKNLFTPNSLEIAGFNIVYPNIIYTISFLVLNFGMSYLMVAIYSAIKNETKDFIAFYLAIFISLVLFTIILLSIDKLIIAQLDFKSYVFNLTTGFVVVIVLSIIMLIINSIINRFNNQ